MESATPSLREQGVQALRDGNVDGAIDLLARAVMADGQDVEAQAFLGVAYSQKGLHPQAKRALQTAIELRPQEPRYLFNLGVALELANDLQGAAAAYQRVLQLNPEHPQARAKLQALGSKVASAPAAQAPARAPAAAAPAAEPVPWLAGGPGSAAAPAAGPPGTVQCGQCKQWSKPGLSCEWCSAPLKTAPAAGSYGAVTTSVPYAGVVHEDRFDLVQACKDWLSVLISPNSFFADQQGREGMKAPLAFLFAYLLVNLPFYVLGFVFGKYPGVSPAGTPGQAIFMVIGLPIGMAIYLAMLFVWAGIVHGVSKMFGGQGNYAGSFRVVTYALAPVLLLGLLGTVLVMGMGPASAQSVGARPGSIRAPGRAEVSVQLASQKDSSAMPRLIPVRLSGREGYAASPYSQPPASPLGGANPIGLVVVLAGMLVYLIYLGIGIYHVHNVSSGAAVGVAIISGIAAIVLEFMLAMFLGVVLVAILAGMRGAMH